LRARITTTMISATNRGRLHIRRRLTVSHQHVTQGVAGHGPIRATAGYGGLRIVSEPRKKAARMTRLRQLNPAIVSCTSHDRSFSLMNWLCSGGKPPTNWRTEATTLLRDDRPSRSALLASGAWPTT
jgi:hypothetical protein